MATANVEQTQATEPRESTATPRLPESIQAKLQTVLRQTRRAELIRGGAILVAIVCCTLLLLISLDLLFGIRSSAVRWTIWLAGLAAIGLSTWHFVVRPWRRVEQLLSAAWKIESAHPEMEEKLTSTVQFLAENSNSPTGSRELIAALASRTADDVETVDPGKLPEKNSLPYMAAASVLGLILVLAVVFWPNGVIAALRNMGAPWSTPAGPQLAMQVTPGDITIVDGEDVTVAITAEDGLDSPELVITNANGETEVQAMNSTSPQQAVYTLTGVESSKTYHVRAGGVNSRTYAITVNQRPRLLQVNAEITFPNYTGLDPVTIENLDDAIVAPAGSTIALTAIGDNFAKTAAIQWDAKQEAAPGQTAESTATESQFTWVVSVEPDRTSSGMLVLRSEADAASAPYPVEIRPVADVRPAIEITQPVLPQLVMSRDDILPIHYLAKDDFGLEQIELFVQYGDLEPQQTTIFETKELVTEHSGVHDFAGASAPEDCTQVALWLRATDRRSDAMGGPQHTESDRIVITFATDAPGVGEQLVQEQLEDVVASLDDSLEKLQAAKETAQSLREELANDDLDGQENSDEEIAELIKQTSEARDSIDQLEQLLEEESNLFQPKAKDVSQIAEEHVDPAVEEANRIPLADDKSDQAKHAEQTEQHLDEAIRELQDVKAQVEQQAKDMELAAELDALAQQQERLAEQARQAAEEEPGDEAPNDDWREQQEKVAEGVQELVEESPEARQEQLLQRAEQAEELANQADQLAQQQEKLRDATQGNQEQPPTDEELKQQLRELIAAEQQEIARKTKDVAEQGDNAPELDEAQRQMQETTEKLNNAEDGQAEQAARKAADAMQPKDSQPADNDADNDPSESDPSENSQQAGEDQEAQVGKLARQQERIADAIEAINKDDFDKAAQKLQEQISERTRDLREQAEEIGKLNNEDPNAREELANAAQQLQEAQEQAADADRRLAEPNEPAEQQPEQPADEQQENDAQQGDNTQQGNDAQQANADQQSQDNDNSGQQDANNDNNQNQQAGDQSQQQGDQSQQQGNAQDQQDQKQNAGDQAQQNQSDQGQKSQDQQDQQAGDQAQQGANQDNQDQNAANKDQQQQGANDQSQQAQNQQAQNQDAQQQANQDQQGDQQQGQDAQNQQQSKPPQNQADQKDGQAEQPQDQQNQPQPNEPKPQQTQPSNKDAACNSQQCAAEALKKASESLKKASSACKECANPGSNPGSGQGQGSGQSQSGQPKPGSPEGQKPGQPSSQQGSQNNAQQGQQADGQKPNGTKPGQSANQGGAQGQAQQQGGQKPNGQQPGQQGQQGDSQQGQQPDGQQGQQSGSQEGQQSGSQQGEQSSGQQGSNNSGQQGSQPNPAGLAKAGDAAKQAAGSQSQQQAARQAEQAAQQLNQLAEQAARESGFPQRQPSGEQSNQGKPEQDGGDANGAGQKSPPSDSQDPAGQQGNSANGVGAAPSNAAVNDQQVRGESTNSWTAPRTKHKDSVLDDQESTIPAEYRRLVERYFEELSKQGAKKDSKDK